MPKLFDWRGNKNVNIDSQQLEKLKVKKCTMAIFTELRRAGFTVDYGNTRCFNAAKDAIKKLGPDAEPNRLCQFAMDYLLKERDLSAEEAWLAEIRL